MIITDNLKDDISNAPDWFKEAIKSRSDEIIIDDPKGKVSYTKWSAKKDSKNLIIFIHGTGAHKKWWDPIAPQFLDLSHVIALDLPGMGDSNFRESYSIKDFGKCVISIIKREKKINDIENIFIIGQSLGGQVCCQQPP